MPYLPLAVRCLPRMVLTFTLLLAGGCGQPNEPQLSFLVGQWGSTTADFIAIRAGAELRLACTLIVMDDPIPLQPDGTFSVLGRLQASGPQIQGELPRVRVSGTIAGAHATIIAPSVHRGTPETLALEAGVTPQGEPPMCPL
jgi:hypothetical protein